MKMSPKKIALYTLLLGAAGIGMTIDRLYAPVAAKTVTPLRLALQELTRTDEELPSDIGPPIAAIFDPAKKAGSFAKTDGTDASAEAVKDAFSLSSRMLDIYQRQATLAVQAKEVVEKQKELEAQNRVTDFTGSHRLKATFLHPTDTWIVVDDRILRIGDQVDGFTLRRIERYRAVFAAGKELAELKLPSATDTKVSPANSR